MAEERLTEEPLVLSPEDVGKTLLSCDIDDYPGGIVVPVDKPYRWTSADVIRKLKFLACKHFHKKNLKVGHAGTLDPLATGVLLVCIGKATKLAEALQRHEKEYVAGVSFGATTPSYDLEKAIDKMYPTGGVTEDSLLAVLPGFLGEQEQIAPLFSAKSVDGVRAYELARAEWKKMSRGLNGEFDHSAAEILSRQTITISELELLQFLPDGLPTEVRADADSDVRNSRINVTDNSALHLPHADIRVVCSKGTYIRALARDLGEALGSGAHLDGLKRTRTGGFRIENALSVQDASALLG